MTEETTMTAEQRLDALAAELGLSLSAKFVPFSLSRNAKPSPFNGGKPWQSLNWSVEIRRGESVILRTDYGQGVANCPAYKAGRTRWTTDREKEAAIAIECECGRAAAYSHSLGRPYATSRDVPPPKLADVLASLALDASAIDHPSFESWAGDYGYDPDSRAAESTYRACLEHALVLRSLLGEDGLARLRDIASEY